MKILPEAKERKYCYLDMVENKYHFLLVCPFYRDFRRKYLKPIIANGQHLITDNVMSKKPVLLNLSKCLYLATK